MKRKWLVVGIIFISIWVSVPVVAPFIHMKPIYMLGSPTIDITPSDGLYWNDHKIVDYPVPLFLHYYFKIWATIPITIFINASDAEGFERVEFYINDLLQFTMMGPGPQYGISYNVTIPPFHHSSTFGIKVYVNGGEVMSDNVTIYRLFP